MWSTDFWFALFLGVWLCVFDRSQFWSVFCVLLGSLGFWWVWVLKLFLWDFCKVWFQTDNRFFLFFDVDETTKVSRLFLPIIIDVNYTPVYVVFCWKTTYGISSNNIIHDPIENVNFVIIFYTQNNWFLSIVLLRMFLHTRYTPRGYMISFWYQK